MYILLKDFCYGHIVTVNPRITKHIKLRNILGEKYGETRKIDFDQARVNIVYGIENCISA